uniref:Uncharacterized protein n=1 Tax=Timema monikensis TaxID=170555 RepID=A0A7R9HQI1_9NEOP|nr:unnamed protein product [Timema monikensis]
MIERITAGGAEAKMLYISTDSNFHSIVSDSNESTPQPCNSGISTHLQENGDQMISEFGLYENGRLLGK